VINLSLEGSLSSTLDAVVEGAVAMGFFVVVAAGNNAADACTESPSRVSTAMTVGATDDTDTMSSFSNYGSCVKIFAPGSAIYSAWYTSPTAYRVLSGTSMASPCVAGVYALYLQVNPSLSPADMMAYVQSVATTGVINSLGIGSPNLLVYSLGNGTANASATTQAPTTTRSGSHTWLWGLFGLLGLVFLLMALLLGLYLHAKHRRERQREAPARFPPTAPDVPIGGVTPAPTPTPAGFV